MTSSRAWTTPPAASGFGAPVSALGASSVATDGWFSAADAAALPSEELANISVEQLKIQLLHFGAR